MKTYKVEILGLSELKKKGSGEMKLANNYSLIYAGVPKVVFAKEGVGLVMSPNMYDHFEDWEPISPRMIAADFQRTIGKISIIQVYAPTKDASVVNKEAFFSDLQKNSR